MTDSRTVDLNRPADPQQERLAAMKQRAEFHSKAVVTPMTPAYEMIHDLCEVLLQSPASVPPPESVTAVATTYLTALPSGVWLASRSGVTSSGSTALVRPLALPLKPLNPFRRPAPMSEKTIEGRTTPRQDVRPVSHNDWRAEAVRLFGVDAMAWRFVCPGCGHVASAADWKAAGAPSRAIAYSCVGRWLPDARDWLHGKGPGPCNYAGGGLFGINPVAVDRDGITSHVFAFAAPNIPPDPAGGA
jgi:hypothetical protein